MNSKTDQPKTKTIHNYLLEYVEAGYCVTPLRGKIPGKSWQKTEYEISPDLEKFPENFGIVLQDDDLVIDVDPRNFKPDDKPMKRLAEYLGISFKKIAVVVKTGGGGHHLYFKKPSDLAVRESLSGYPGIEFKSRGRQVVGAGCIHPDTKKSYLFSTTSPKQLRDVEEVPRVLLDLIKREQRSINKDGAVAVCDDSPTNVNRYIRFLETCPPATEGEHGDKTTYVAACKGKELGLSPAIAFSMLELHFNPKCEPPWPLPELKRKVLNAYAYAQNTQGVDSLTAQFPNLPAETEAVRWDMTEAGQRKKTLNNCVNYFLMEGSEIRDLLSYNEFTEQVVFVSPAPWHPKMKVWPRDGRPWRDEDGVMCRFYLSSEHKFDAQVRVIEEAATVAAKKNPNHPVKNYLNGLKWDKTERLETWLMDHCGAMESMYVRAISAKTLIGAVARIYEPGCKFDYMTVIEGEQGIGKSTIVSILGGPWYGDLTIDPHSRDTVAAMRGKWIVEASEMEFASRAEGQALKAFLTRQHDHVRMAYGRHVRNYARQCIIIGTKNVEADPGYLKDMTGNRRFWPVVTQDIDLRSLGLIRDQLFAEAVVRYQAGECLFIEDNVAHKESIQEQLARRVTDPWLSKIDEWSFDKETTTSMEIWTDCLMGLEKNLSRKEQNRIAHIMKTDLGWSGGTFYHDKKCKPVYGYRRPGP